MANAPVTALKLAPKDIPTEGLAPPLPAHLTRTMRKLANGIGRNPIEVGFTIYSVTKIDPVEQSFMCDLKIFCRWHDGAMEKDPDMVALRNAGTFANGDAFDKDAAGRWPHFIIKEIDPETVANSHPSYSFTNAMDVQPVDGTLVVYLSPNDAPGYVRSEERWRGSFFHEMGLAAFPFDTQQLRISLRLPRRKDSGRSFTQFHSSMGPQMEMKDWVRLAEWVRYEPSAEMSTDSKGRAKYTIKIPLVRRYEYYLWSILAIVGAISFLAFVSFAISADDLPGRSSLVVTLLLTAVAFKLVISDILPKVAYWTCLDYYINAMFLMLLIIALENGCVGLVAGRFPTTFEQYGHTIEYTTVASVALLWAAFHGWFVWHVLTLRGSETAQLAGLKQVDEAARSRYLEQQAAQLRRNVATPKSAPTREGGYQPLAA